jgi:hypothetical protein
MKQKGKGWKAGPLGLALALVVVIGTFAFPASAPAQATSCGSVVKKIYYNAGFYKAQVLVTRGSVPCAEARRVIWKALKPGGFSGQVNGWTCEPKGHADPYKEKCESEDATIKSGKPKPCASCHRNAKRQQLTRSAQRRAGSWKNCGLFHYRADRYIRTEAKRVGCTEARRVGRKVALHSSSVCPTAGFCEVAGFECPVNPMRSRILCTRAEDAAHIRLKGETKR